MAKHECDCGRSFNSYGGLELCQATNHGNPPKEEPMVSHAMRWDEIRESNEESWRWTVLRNAVDAIQQLLPNEKQDLQTRAILFRLKEELEKALASHNESQVPLDGIPDPKGSTLY